MSEKKNRRTNLLAVLGLLVLAGLIGWMYYQWWLNRLDNWEVTLSPDHEIPYGTKVLRELLKEKAGGGQFRVERRRRIAEQLLEMPNETQNLYLFIGNRFFPSEADRDTLLQFVHQGNTAFIAAPSAYQTFQDTLGLPALETDSEQTDLISDSTAQAYLQGTTAYPFTLSDGYDTTTYQWSFFQLAEALSAQENVHTLGSFRRNDSTFVNFIRVEYGQGRLFMHSEPILFANYFLLDSIGYAYTNALFVNFSEENDMYWDQRSHLPDFSVPTPELQAKESPLRFILSQRGLTWAYYVLLGLTALFVIFQGKRRQRVIPVLPRVENTSLTFVQTIGQLHFEQKNHHKLALLKRDLFLDFLRSHYFIRAGSIHDEGLEKELQLQSQLAIEAVQQLLDKLRKLDEQKKLSDQALTELHRQLFWFYAFCK